MPRKKDSIDYDDSSDDEDIDTKKKMKDESSDVESLSDTDDDIDDDDEEEDEDIDDTDINDKDDEEEDTEKMNNKENDEDEDDDIDFSDTEDLDTDLYISDTLNDIDLKKTHENKILLNNKKTKVTVLENDDRITKNILSKYEFTKIISERANSLENGAAPLVEVDKNMSVQEIAYLEILNKKCPYFVYRQIAFGMKENIYEKWDVNQMIIPYFL